MQLVNVIAASVDGKIAPHPLADHASRLACGLTSAEDQAFLKNEFAHCDAVIVGGRTVVADGSVPEWPGRSGAPPIWYVLTRSGLPANLRFMQQAVKKVIVTPQDIRDENPATFVYELIRSTGARTVLLLGGGSVNKMFYAAGLVDSLKLTLSPTILGSVAAAPIVEAGLPSSVSLHLVSSHAVGSYVFLNYTVHVI